MRVIRHVVKVDDMDATLMLNGAVLHVDCRDLHEVDVWTLDTGGPTVERTFRVFGTGQPVPDGWRHVGTALSPHFDRLTRRGDLVWHLFEAKS